MKILVLSDDFPPDVAGGAGVMAFRITKEFVHQGHEVLVLAATSNPEKIGRKTFQGIEIEYFYSSYHERWRAYLSLWNPAGRKAVAHVLQNFEADIVHAHNIHMHISYASLVLAKKFGCRVYMTAHDIMAFYPGTFTEFINPKDFSMPTVFNYRVSAFMMCKKFRLRFNPFRNWAIQCFLRKIDGVVAVSGALKDALSRNGIKNITVIKNGIDAATWDVLNTDVEDFKKSQGIANGERKASDSRVVLFGGRLSGGKGGELILLAMQKVVALVPDATLLVAGRKDFYASRMAEKIQKLGITNVVVFSGWLNEADMKKAYAASSVVVTPSVCFDSFPNTNLEAFAAGRPVIATCFGGSNEIVHPGENGALVNPFDVSTLTMTIIDFLKDTTKAEKFGENGRKLVLEKFTIERVAENYIALFSK